MLLQKTYIVETEQLKGASNLIEEAIASRPGDIKVLDKILNHFIGVCNNSDTIEQDEDQTEIEEVNSKKSKTIKDSSPFSKHYLKLQDKMEHCISVNCSKYENSTSNMKYCPKLISFLTEKFMPYAFIWASFTCTELKFTRLTNGLVENYNRYRKADTPRDLLPHRYTTTSVKYIIGSNKKYLSELMTNF
jgi:hypothetical protein